MIKNLTIIGYLAVLSIIDIKEKKIPTCLLAVGVVCGVVVFIFQLANEKAGVSTFFIKMVQDLAVGGMLFLIAAVTRKAGYADGIVLMGIGLSYGMKSVLFSFFLSIWIMALFSVVLIALRKVRKDSELPYIPFITVGQVIFFLWEYGVAGTK